jgi:hypothetical protein
MDAIPLIAGLERLAGTVREAELAEELAGIVALAPARLAGALARSAREILSLPWGLALPTAPARALAAVCGCDGAGDLLGAMLGQGLAAGAVQPGAPAGWWVPAWLADEAERRAGTALSGGARRWIIAARWPVPVEQVLVRPLALDEALRQRLLLQLQLVPPLPVAGAEFPDAWFTGHPPRAPAPDAADLFAFDGRRGMRALLAGGDLAGFAPPLAVLAQRQSARLRAQRRPWDGTLGRGAQLATSGTGVVLLPGWLALVLEDHGCACPGAPPTLLTAVESALVRRCGGAVLEGTGTILHRLPDAAGRQLRAHPLDWRAVPVCA